MNIKPLMTSNSDNWATPKIIYDFFIEKGFKDLFPYCSNFDQYENKDYYRERLFINPPYSHLNKKIFSEYLDLLVKNDNEIILLIPSRTDTKIFHQILRYHPQIYFIEGRLHFNDSDKPSTFPSLLIHIRKTFFNVCVYGFGDVKKILKMIPVDNNRY